MDGFTDGRIVEVQRGLYRVVTEKPDAVFIARTSGKLRKQILSDEAARRGDDSVVHESTVAGFFPIIGDYVWMTPSPSGEYQIFGIYERKSMFSRLNNSGHAEEYMKTSVAQAVAANFDYVFIMQSLNYDFNLRRIERYMTLSWQSGAIPAVILTKADLVDDAPEKIREAEKAASGVGVFAVSSKTGEGLDALSDYLSPGKTVVFLGSSGVGKSSLVNALAGEDVMAVKEIREDDSKGRHTTTYRRLITLANGVSVIDTPGMRELGMYDVDEGIGQSFSDVTRYFGQCKFNDCGHKSEPGCAIKAAIESGELSAERWQSYLSLTTEIKYSDDREAYLKMKFERNRAIAKNSINMKKNGEIRY